jgi:hypothetical protein
VFLANDRKRWAALDTVLRAKVDADKISGPVGLGVADPFQRLNVGLKKAQLGAER